MVLSADTNQRHQHFSESLMAFIRPCPIREQLRTFNIPVVMGSVKLIDCLNAIILISLFCGNRLDLSCTTYGTCWIRFF